MTNCMTIGDLEKAAGITDRAAFWSQFSHIKGADEVNGKLRSRALEAGIAELRTRAAQGVAA